MKKINNNNKFRGNAVYSLNYKFDSVSPAGKCSGTALDLIKRYNELAKEAQNNGDYVGMEVFRQYAEHYRKIVTEINERKYQSREQPSANNAPSENGESAPVADNGLVETESAAPVAPTAPAEPTENVAETVAEKPQLRRRRNFTVVEVSEPEKTPENAEAKSAEAESKPRRRPYVRRNKATTEAAEA